MLSLVHRAYPGFEESCENSMPEKIITAVLDRETTCASNKIQKERQQLRKDEGIHFPDEFSFESVKERLDDYDISGEPMN